MARAGIPTQNHSVHIGAAMAAAQAGLQDLTIQALGRWSSTAFLRYIRPGAILPYPPVPLQRASDDFIATMSIVFFVCCCCFFAALINVIVVLIIIVQVTGRWWGTRLPTSLGGGWSLVMGLRSPKGGSPSMYPSHDLHAPST